jgi:hypothetical protein
MWRTRLAGNRLLFFRTMLQEIFSIEPGIDRILPLGTFSGDAGRTVAVTALNARGRLLRQP